MEVIPIGWVSRKVTTAIEGIQRPAEKRKLRKAVRFSP